MRRLRRILVTGLTILSLLLCMGTGGLWVRSYWAGDSVTYWDTTSQAEQYGWRAAYYVGIFVLSADRYRFEPGERDRFIQLAQNGRSDAHVHLNHTEVDSDERAEVRG